jgi:hypothetical protein
MEHERHDIKRRIIGSSDAQNGRGGRYDKGVH